jgi:DNA-binding IclR family transcriptional regulator
VLQLVAEGASVRVAEVADRLGVARSSAFRLLATLQHAGLLTQDPETKAYCAGRTLTSLGLSAVDRLELRRAARSHLEALRTMTGETSVAGILDGAELLVVESVPGWMPLRVVDRPGDRFPAHLSAGGKAILAELSNEELHALYPDEQLSTMTALSVATRTALEAELVHVRTTGYATTSDQVEDDVRAVAAAITDRQGVVRGALAVTFPSVRADRNTESLGPHVVQAARAVGELMLGLSGD